ncbi:MAG: hypothetical protein KAR20_11175 [Candidatus Heimdallarchaeota archaeon]|nr:hypothetical protein [Candidatus Heimdallarchaeota archaeon]
MKQSLNRLLYKFGSKRGFITAIVSAVGVIISGLWFRYGIQLLHTEAIPIIIFIGFILGGILLELVIFRLISNGMLVLSTEVINANTSSDAEIAENDNIPLDALPSDSDENAESDNDTISDNEN